jgi:hypothetical protein
MLGSNYKHIRISGPVPPCCWGFEITLRHTTLGRAIHAEWSARRINLFLTTNNSHKRQTIMHWWDSNPRAVADTRFGPRGHWDGLLNLLGISSLMIMINGTRVWKLVLNEKWWGSMLVGRLSGFEGSEVSAASATVIAAAVNCRASFFCLSISWSWKQHVCIQAYTTHWRAMRRQLSLGHSGCVLQCEEILNKTSGLLWAGIA